MTLVPRSGEAKEPWPSSTGYANDSLSWIGKLFGWSLMALQYTLHDAPVFI